MDRPQPAAQRRKRAAEHKRLEHGSEKPRDKRPDERKAPKGRQSNREGKDGTDKRERERIR